MTTTTFNHAGLRTLRRAGDRFAAKGFFSRLWDSLIVPPRLEAATIVARYAGDRWCDSTERRLVDDLTNRSTMRF